ncbi:MAG TPA: DsbA family protein [Polyangiaceae bacterium]|nr:DsbA family protein [Polyangiaceae bacterium]
MEVPRRPVRAAAGARRPQAAGAGEAGPGAGARHGEVQAALDSHKHKARVDADMKVGNDAGISGTPASVVNQYFVSGAQPFPAFKKVIELALKEAK